MNNEHQDIMPDKRQIGPKIDVELTRLVKVYCFQNGIDFQDFVEDAMRAHYANVLDVSGEDVTERNDDNE